MHPPHAPRTPFTSTRARRLPLIHCAAGRQRRAQPRSLPLHHELQVGVRGGAAEITLDAPICLFKERRCFLPCWHASIFAPPQLPPSRHCRPACVSSSPIPSRAHSPFATPPTPARSVSLARSSVISTRRSALGRPPVRSHGELPLGEHSLVLEGAQRRRRKDGVGCDAALNDAAPVNVRAVLIGVASRRLVARGPPRLRNSCIRRAKREHTQQGPRWG